MINENWRKKVFGFFFQKWQFGRFPKIEENQNYHKLLEIVSSGFFFQEWRSGMFPKWYYLGLDFFSINDALGISQNLGISNFHHVIFLSHDITWLKMHQIGVKRYKKIESKSPIRPRYNPDDHWHNRDDPWDNPNDLWYKPDDPRANPDDRD